MSIFEAMKDMQKEEPQEADISTDKFSDKEQKEIVKMVVSDIEANETAQIDWIEKRKQALRQYNAEKPSILEGINIRPWQSDRNLGVCPAVCDTYQSTLMATCWNPDSIHFVATEENDIDNKDNLERFSKWMVAGSEVNASPEVDDFIQNKITQGFSIFEIYWNVWFEWVDRKIPNKDANGMTDGTYTIKTEKVRFEKAVLENIDNLDDILMPRYGDDIQKLPNIIRILHLTGEDILDLGNSGVFMNVDSKFVESVKVGSITKAAGIEDLRAKDLGLSDVVDDEYRNMPIDLYRWYGYYTKNGRRERYRFIVERTTNTLLSGKPLRKITKTGKYPFVGGPFDRIPGQLRGKDLPTIIADPVNAINLTFNQKSDFQYITNCPFGFHKAGEGYTKGNYDLEPGVNYVTEGNPSDEIFFPNLQRSMAWASQDLQILFEVIEKRTGAASYFATNNRNADNTATRDTLVARNSETRFGKWVMRIQNELSDAVTMLVNLYQENAPKNLGQRILGDDGKKLFPNLSPETLRYNGDARMVPDIIAGSKAYERQVFLWAYQALSQSIWLNPQLNPKGSWLLTSDTMKKMGIPAPDRYLPPEPKPEMGTSRTIDMIWSQLMQGEVVEPDQTWNIPEVLAGLYKKKSDSYFDLDPEYRPNLDSLIFKMEVEARIFMQKMMEQQMADQMAKRAIMMGQAPQGMPQNGPQMPPGEPLPGEGQLPPQALPETPVSGMPMPGGPFNG